MQIEALTELKNHSRAKLYPGNKEFYIDVFIFLWNLQWVAEELENNLMQISMQDGLENISLQVAGKYSRHAIEYINETRERVNKCFRKDTDEDREYNDRLQLLESEDNTQEPDFHIKFEGGGEIDLPLPAAEVALYLNRICRYFLPVFQKYITKQPSSKNSQTESVSAKLKFACDNKQVYDAFRWMREKKWINATVEEIAEFIFYNIEFQEGSPGINTIRTAIARKGTDEDGRATLARPVKRKRFNPEKE